MKITKETFLSPPLIFIGYMVMASMGIIVFRLLFLPESPPLSLYVRSWRLVQGVLDFISFFPALTMSGLVIPFGLLHNFPEEFDRFSPTFLEQIKSFIIIAIVTLFIYGFLFFLAFPIVRDYESHLRYNGYLFNSSKEKAYAHAKKEAWPEALQFITICDQIWPNSPEIYALRREVTIRFDEWRVAQVDAQKEAWVTPDPHQDIMLMYSGLPGQQKPVNATEALVLAEKAMLEERYYDAHWLASLGVRLAKRGSLERVQGTRLANQSWNAVADLGPNTRESRIYSLYHKKQEGYEALVSEDWIKAYYIFKELSVETPGDPDVARFFALSEKGTKEIAFFTDEMDLTLGQILTEALFSFPLKASGGGKDGQMVLRASSLSTSREASYGIEVEIMAFNGEGNLLYQVTAPYVKIVPITQEGMPKLLIMMDALDRLNKDRRYEPVWISPDNSVDRDVKMILDLSYEDFLLLSRLRRGLDPLLLGDLFAVADRIGSYGYIPEFFQAKILSRIAEVTIFFPLMMLVIILGWNYRSRKRTPFMGLLMLVGFPLVFSGILFLCRNLFDVLSIRLVISLGFSITIGLFIIGTIFLFVFTLILLAAQQNKSKG